MKILILNGLNLNIIEKRDKDKYGNLTLDEINNSLAIAFPDVNFTFIQSNSEEQLINQIQNCQDFDGLIINPGGLTHSSVGLRDALEILGIPKIEVHLSNLASREEFRKNMITTSKVTGYISGFKEIGYFAAVYTLAKLISDK